MSERRVLILDVSNVDQLRANIDAGGTGDKVSFPDPAAAPLGTDAEAAGFPPTQRELRLEAVSQAGSPISTGWPDDTVGIVVYCAAVFLVGLAIMTIAVLS